MSESDKDIYAKMAKNISVGIFTRNQKGTYWWEYDLAAYLREVFPPVPVAELEISKNLHELGDTPSPRIKTGRKISFDNKSVELYEHEDGQAITLMYHINDKRTARIALSRLAAFHTLELLEQSMVMYIKNIHAQPIKIKES
jgi:hypothetical protein